ncbi:uncharacterized protein LACBIDRAFT_329644 [Laccaria bicolor S238N-H82]|uniref:Predicted protein n=1 Tax=Laccaria bicolor (strain S238N-H82 / ATCC MYA-4686) TaxID=486041 RepID=B0DIP3_LACBS|nr:uncharacterized protein LACBIDRAFT_329644 [Laccaria bicolor S238N-H82]EDR05721.1 predicted protein [Laccaria bicolor S238N-H82]|eukprot:XP_001883825.1 predicted protein [Laccaria bicolor S238N-H82]
MHVGPTSDAVLLADLQSHMFCCLYDQNRLVVLCSAAPFKLKPFIVTRLLYASALHRDQIVGSVMLGYMFQRFRASALHLDQIVGLVMLGYMFQRFRASALHRDQIVGLVMLGYMFQRFRASALHRDQIVGSVMLKPFIGILLGAWNGDSKAQMQALVLCGLDYHRHIFGFEQTREFNKMYGAVDMVQLPLASAFLFFHPTFINALDSTLQPVDMSPEESTPRNLETFQAKLLFPPCISRKYIRPHVWDGQRTAILCMLSTDTHLPIGVFGFQNIDTAIDEPIIHHPSNNVVVLHPRRQLIHSPFRFTFGHTPFSNLRSQRSTPL